MRPSGLQISDWIGRALPSTWDGDDAIKRNSGVKSHVIDVRGDRDSCSASALSSARCWVVSSVTMAHGGPSLQPLSQRLQFAAGAFRPAGIAHSRPGEDRPVLAQSAPSAPLVCLLQGLDADRRSVHYLQRDRRGLQRLLGPVGQRCLSLERALDWSFARRLRCLPGSFPSLSAGPGERATILTGVAGACIGLLVMAFATEGWMIFAIMAVFLLGGIGAPALQSLATRKVDETQQGQFQGVLASAVSLASIASPLAFSSFYFVFRQEWPGAIWLSVVASIWWPYRSFSICDLGGLQRAKADRDF